MTLWACSGDHAYNLGQVASPPSKTPHMPLTQTTTADDMSPQTPKSAHRLKPKHQRADMLICGCGGAQVDDRKGDAYMNAMQPLLATCPWIPIIGNRPSCATGCPWPLTAFPWPPVAFSRPFLGLSLPCQCLFLASHCFSFTFHCLSLPFIAFA